MMPGDVWSDVAAKWWPGLRPLPGRTGSSQLREWQLVTPTSNAQRRRWSVAALLAMCSAVGACSEPREIEITWQNDTGRTVAYYPVRRGLDDLGDTIGNLSRNIYPPGAQWRDDLDVGDGEAPWCPRGEVPYDFYFVEPLPSAPIEDGRIDHDRVTVDDIEVVAVVPVDEDFCFPDRTGNTYSVTENGGS